MADYKYNVLIAPVVTEKSLDLVDTENQYTFKVDMNATKKDVKLAVEEKFDVEVLDVKTHIRLGKRVRFGRNRTEGRRSNEKRAIVKLASDDSIDIFKVK